MRILLIFDNKYAPHAATVMESVIQNASVKLDFAIMYFEGNLSIAIQEKLLSHFTNRVNSLSFYPVQSNLKDIFSQISFANYLSINAFLRIFTPNILTNDDVVLYLDCDLIVLGDITELMNCANLKYAINAIAEHYPSLQGIEQVEAKKKSRKEKLSLQVDKMQIEKKKMLGMSLESPYFSSGVMILNLKLWREQNLVDKAVQYVSSHPVLYCADQDVLNGILDGNFGKLPLVWNIIPYVYLLNEYTSCYSKEELLSVKNNPKIIHFAGLKAWQYLYRNGKEKKLYWKYRATTPWPEREEEGKTYKNILNKCFYYPVISIVTVLFGENTVKKIRIIKNKLK